MRTKGTMRKLSNLATMALAVVAVSCSEQALEISVAPAEAEQGSEKVFYASFDGETKSYLSMNGDGSHADVLWNAGDEILVRGLRRGADLAVYTGYFTTQDEGTLTASFSSSYWHPGDINEVRAFYPSNLWPLGYGKVDGGKDVNHAVIVPPVQQAVAGGLQKGLSMAVAQNNSTDTDEFHFKNILSFIRFRLSGSGVNKLSKIRLYSGVDYYGPVISGDGIYSPATMSFVSTYYPSAAQYGGGLKFVELRGPFVAGEDYYIAVRPCTLDGFNLRFFDDEGNIISKSSDKTFELQRSRISDFGTITIEDTFGDLPSGVERYLTHTKGSKPVCIAVLGDAFTASEQDKFKVAAHKAVDAIFSVEPYKTYKDYFNVYIMSAVSNEAGASVTDGNGNIVTPHDTYFGTSWGADSYSDMNTNSVRIFHFVSYRCPEILNGECTIDEVPVLLIVNDNRYGGTCWYWTVGRSIGIVPTIYMDTGGYYSVSFMKQVAANNESPDSEMRNFTDEERNAIGSPITGTWLNTVIHEFGGHGFGGFGDEYWYDPIRGEGPIDSHTWTVPRRLNLSASYNDVPWQSEVLDVVNGNSNITVGPEKMSFYSSREGIFQGGGLCALGRWRSEIVSCMVDNRLYFSLWQRILIVKRIMSLAGETFDLQDFYDKDVPYDPHRDSQAASAPAQIARKAGKGTIVHEVPMTPPPRVFYY